MKRVTARSVETFGWSSARPESAPRFRYRQITAASRQAAGSRTASGGHGISTAQTSASAESAGIKARGSAFFIGGLLLRAEQHGRLEQEFLQDGEVQRVKNLVGAPLGGYDARAL